MSQVIVSGSFDDLRSGRVRLLQEAARRGPLHVLLWSDDAVQAIEGRPPKFPEDERRYLLESIRYVDRVSICRSAIMCDGLPGDATEGFDHAAAATWVAGPDHADAATEAFCRTADIEYRVLPPEDLQGFPEDPADARDVLSPDMRLPSPPTPLPQAGEGSRCCTATKRVLATGCYDWFHSGHVRFFEEVSQLGELYVVVGHDANIRLLKGAGHPMFSELERRYMVQSIRFVHQALVSSGDGWLDAEPEIQRIRPHIYAVNEDGDRPEKRAYCQAHGIEYRVLKRTPKPGLPKRQSTDLRGF